MNLNSIVTYGIFRIFLFVQDGLTREEVENEKIIIEQATTEARIDKNSYYSQDVHNLHKTIF